MSEYKKNAKPYFQRWKGYLKIKEIKNKTDVNLSEKEPSNVRHIIKDT